MALWSDRFGKKDDELPPELQGKKPDEVVAEMRRLDALAKDTEAKRLTLETEHNTQKNEFDQMKTRIAELEAGGRKKDDEIIIEDPPSPWTDPVKFVQEATKDTTAVALASGIMSAKMYAMQQLSARDLKIFKKYEKEIDAQVGTFQPVQRVMPQSWFNTLIYIKGLHDQEITKLESDKNDFFSERPSDGVHHDEHRESELKLSPEEEEVCRKFKYDPKKYLETKKNASMRQSEKGQYASYAVPNQTRNYNE